MKNILFLTIILTFNSLLGQVKDSISSNQQPEELEEVVVSGTLKSVKRLETPVPVEIYTTAFL